MRRKLFTILAAVSLALCFAVCDLWLRSIGHRGYVWWIGAQHEIEFEDVDGVAGILLTRDCGLRPPIERTTKLYGWFFDGGRLAPERDRASLMTPSFNRWGFGAHVGRTIGRPRGYWRFGGRILWIAYLPYWVLAAFTGAPPLLLCLNHLRRIRQPRGFCAFCGYDLRATPDRCPECGRAVTTKGTMRAT